MLIESTNAARDALLQLAINTAAAGINKRTGRVFERSASVSAFAVGIRGRVVRDDDGERLLLPRDVATTEGLLVETGAGTSWSTVTGWEAELEDRPGEDAPIVALVLPGRCWSGPRARITAVWGWPSVPAPITQARLIQASRLASRAKSPEGVLGSSEWGAVRVGRIDPDVAAIVQDYEQVGIA